MKEKKEMRWNLSDIGTFFKNSFIAVMKGEFLLRMNVGRYLIHIAYTFLLICIAIWVSLMIETTMARVERNKLTLRELEIEHSAKTFEVVSLSRRTTVEGMLRDMGSAVGEPTEPATVLK